MMLSWKRTLRYKNWKFHHVIFPVQGRAENANITLDEDLFMSDGEEGETFTQDKMVAIPFHTWYYICTDFREGTMK